jgi:3-deoxy-D-manno-octulosonate 8-phosphate phosphatase (KDO 8-P phosphatase)
MRGLTMKDSNIKLLIMDVDGTLTDGKVYMSEHGELFKAFDIKDGLGIHNILPSSGIIPVIITGRRSNILKLRCDEIGIKYLYQGVSDKTGTLDSLLSELALDYSNCAYIGDDINDLSCMRKVALVGCPADAVRDVISIADFVSSKNGGCGAVRDFIEWLVE